MILHRPAFDILNSHVVLGMCDSLFASLDRNSRLGISSAVLAASNADFAVGVVSREITSSQFPAVAVPVYATSITQPSYRKMGT